MTQAMVEHAKLPSKLTHLLHQQNGSCSHDLGNDGRSGDRELSVIRAESGERANQRVQGHRREVRRLRRLTGGALVGCVVGERGMWMWCGEEF